MSQKFNYVYVAPTEEERKEIDCIRRQYAPQEKGQSKLERLRDLHKKVKNGATMVALSLGIAGCLTFGAGLAFVLEWGVLAWGILLSALGSAGMAASYPVYTRIIKRNKKKYGTEILRLSEELLRGEE